MGDNLLNDLTLKNVLLKKFEFLLDLFNFWASLKVVPTSAEWVPSNFIFLFWKAFSIRTQSPNGIPKAFKSTRVSSPTSISRISPVEGLNSGSNRVHNVKTWQRDISFNGDCNKHPLQILHASIQQYLGVLWCPKFLQRNLLRHLPAMNCLWIMHNNTAIQWNHHCMYLIGSTVWSCVRSVIIYCIYLPSSFCDIWSLEYIFFCYQSKYITQRNVWLTWQSWFTPLCIFNHKNQANRWSRHQDLQQCTQISWRWTEQSLKW